jgi:pimeloyl-ACP methyl ester carboxylesterase
MVRPTNSVTANHWAAKAMLEIYGVASRAYARIGKPYIFPTVAPTSSFIIQPPSTVDSCIRFCERPHGSQSYLEVEQKTVTADGMELKYSCLTRDDLPAANAGPAILLVPGFACNHDFYDLNDRDSLALDLADAGGEINLFDPRGMGRNRRPGLDCTFDTIADFDLPAAIGAINSSLSSGRQIIIIGHSMGGMLAEFMLVYQANQLNILCKKIAVRCGLPLSGLSGLTRVEIAVFLDKALSIDSETRAMIKQARNILALLNSVKGIITIGEPKIFNREDHFIWPMLLMLNVVLPVAGAKSVPMERYKQLSRYFSSLKRFPGMLINPSNFADPTAFLDELIKKGTGNIPLGVGAQLLRSVYSGKGFKRMERGGFNYVAHLDLIPPDMPIFQVNGDRDVLAPPHNLRFIDRQYAAEVFDPFGFPPYRHQQRQVDVVCSIREVEELALSSGPSQVRGFLFPGIGHLDYFYGTRGLMARKLIQRLVGVIGNLQ